MEEDIVCPYIRQGERQMNKEYPSTDIPVSSLTYALKGQKLLEQKGFRAWRAETMTASRAVDTS